MPAAMARIADGRPELAEPPLRGDIELLGEMSGNATLATTTALLAQAWGGTRMAVSLPQPRGGGMKAPLLQTVL